MASPEVQSVLDTTLVVRPEVAEYFEGVGLFEPPVNNKRKISTFTISASLSKYSNSFSSYDLTRFQLIDGTDHFPAAAIAKVSNQIEIPVLLESLETLEMIGYCPAKARDIWERWAAIPEDEMKWGDFQEFSVDFVKYAEEDAFNGEDNWEECLDRAGISEKLKTAILLPEYEAIRYTASCMFWVEESIKGNFHALNSLNLYLEESAELLRSIGYNGREVELPQRTGSHRRPPGTHPRDFKETREVSDLSPSPTVAGTKLYRASDLHRALRYYNHETGEARDCQFGSFPGDLAGICPLTYWTPQREVADLYAGYLKHRIDLSQIVITEVEVSEELVASLNSLLFWGATRDGVNPHFQEFTWLSRRGRARQDIPKHLEYVVGSELVIAHMLDYKNFNYGKRDSWKDIKASDLVEVEINGELKKGIQWAFMSPDDIDEELFGQQLFDQECHGRVIQYNLGRLNIGNVDLANIVAAGEI